MRHAISAGAHGYVPRRATDTEVVEAIRRVAAGEHYVDWLRLRIERRRSLDQPMSGSRLGRDDRFVCDAK